MAKGAYIGVPKFEPVFADNTWSQIIAACQLKDVPSTWKVGDQKVMTIGGVDYPIDIIGKNHDTYADGSGTAPLTFQMHNSYNTSNTLLVADATTSDGGWRDCKCRNVDLPAIMELMPPEVQSAIWAVNKLSDAGHQGTTIYTTADKLFLLSEIEVFGAETLSYGSQGTQYAYYANGGSTVKTVNGTANYWWLRSTLKWGTMEFVCCPANGAKEAHNARGNPFGLAFAFCFGGTSALNGGDGVARRVKKGYIGVGGTESVPLRPLPSGYTQIEYVKTTGRQYVNVGFVPNQDTCVKMTAMNESDSSLWLFGVWEAQGVNQFLACCSSAHSFRYGTKMVSLSTVPVGATVKVELNKNIYDMNGVSGTLPEQTFTCPANMYLFRLSVSGLASGGNFQGRCYCCEVYDNGTLIRDYVPCTNESGAAGLYDVANGVFYGDASGTGFVAGPRVSGVARRIRKAYIGINGVARPCFSQDGLEHWGTATELSAVRSEAAATTVGNYALFGGGGGNNNSRSKVVDAYSASLVRSTPTALSEAKSSLAATTVGNYALFGGGFLSNGASAAVDAYNENLVRSTPTALSKGRYYLDATTVGDYALFGGGSVSVDDFAVVDAYNSSLVRSTPTELSAARDGLAATTVGNYALFGGGYSAAYFSVVDAYNSSLVRSTPTALSEAKSSLAATTVGNYALFGGGNTNYNARSAVVDAYDNSLARSTPTALSAAKSSLAATTVCKYALFGGDGKNFTSVVDAYDENLVHSNPSGLSVGRGSIGATTVGNYALFGGGFTANSGRVGVVDVYTVYE